MPAFVAVPAIATALAASASAAASIHGANKAAKANMTANEQALAFQREQEASRRAQYDQAMAQYKQQWEAWNASRNALLQRYGVDIAPPSGAGAPGAAVPPMAGGGAPGPTGPGPMGGPAPQMARAQGASLGQMMGQGRPAGEWSDWSRYGLRA